MLTDVFPIIQPESIFFTDSNKLYGGIFRIGGGFWITKVLPAQLGLEYREYNQNTKNVKEEPSILAWTRFMSSRPPRPVASAGRKFPWSGAPGGGEPPEAQRRNHSAAVLAAGRLYGQPTRDYRVPGYGFPGYPIPGRNVFLQHIYPQSINPYTVTNVVESTPIYHQRFPEPPPGHPGTEFFPVAQDRCHLEVQPSGYL